LFLFFADQLTEFYSAFNALTYITTRGILSALTALVVSFIIGPKLIQKLSLNDIGESIRKDGPGTHSVKQGTPTMGGLLILFSITISTLIWGDLTSRYIVNVLFLTIAFGLIGFVDDYVKGGVNRKMSDLKTPGGDFRQPIFIHPDFVTPKKYLSKMTVKIKVFQTAKPLCHKSHLVARTVNLLPAPVSNPQSPAAGCRSRCPGDKSCGRFDDTCQHSPSHVFGGALLLPADCISAPPDTLCL